MSYYQRSDTSYKLHSMFRMEPNNVIYFCENRCPIYMKNWDRSNNFIIIRSRLYVPCSPAVPHLTLTWGLSSCAVPSSCSFLSYFLFQWEHDIRMAMRLTSLTNLTRALCRMISSQFIEFRMIGVFIANHMLLGFFSSLLLYSPHQKLHLFANFLLS